MGQWRMINLHNKKLQNFYSFRVVLRMIKVKEDEMEHVARMGKKKFIQNFSWKSFWYIWMYENMGG
jgi:hypothetical protein